ncbi:hypothetical protein Tco_0315551 [Tanacetum coccineum]
MACHDGPIGGHHGANYTAKKSLIQDFIGRLFTEMPMTWSHGVTLVNVKEKSHKGMKCHKMQSKFVRSLTCGASILCDCSRLHEGTSIYSWLSITYQNGWKRRRSPPMTPELIAPDFEAYRAHGFVLRSLELQSLASLWESNIQSYRLTFIFEHT